MKLTNLFEAKVNTIVLMNKAGLYMSEEVFKEHFEYIIDFNERMEKAYKRIKDHFDLTPESTVNLMYSSRINFDHDEARVVIMIDKDSEDKELFAKTLTPFVLKTFENLLPELKIKHNTPQTSKVIYTYELAFARNAAGKKLRSIVPNKGVLFGAPNHKAYSAAARKAIKWW